MSVANLLMPPMTVFFLDHVRPDLLLYRALAYCLVVWEGNDSGASIGVRTTDEWISTCIPKVILYVMI